jgi:hypothetical protein
MTERDDDVNLDVEKDVDIKVETEIKFDVEVDWDASYEIDECIYFDPTVEDNSAFLAVDAEAFGEDTLVDVAASVLVVEDELSSVTLSVIAISTEG